MNPPQRAVVLCVDEKSQALVNNYYFYCVDESFGPFFLKFWPLLPLQRQALPERPRIRQAPIGP
jgi:hypothetical protein